MSWNQSCELVQEKGVDRGAEKVEGGDLWM